MEVKMSQITISLPDELVDRCRALSDQEGYSTLSDFVREALRNRVERTITPSYTERVILNLLLEVQDKLEGNTSNKLFREAIENGFKSEYSFYMTQLAYKDEFEPNKARFVYDVFQCYEEIQRSAVELKDKELTKKVIFPGYDGNNETDYMAFAQFLVKREQYAHLDGAGENMNSHFMTIHYYGQMLERWRRISQNKSLPIQFTKEEIKLILGLGK